MSHLASLHDVVDSRPHKRRRLSLHEDYDVDIDAEPMTEGAVIALKA